MKKNVNKSTAMLSWLLFILTSLALFVGYFYFEQAHGEELAPFLKGLELTGHFVVHFTFGILAGLVILNLYTWRKQKRLNEALILTAAVLFSHFPDIRAWLIGDFIHKSWEIIFLFHTLVDEYPLLTVLWILLDILLIITYYKLIKKWPV